MSFSFIAMCYVVKPLTVIKGHANKLRGSRGVSFIVFIGFYLCKNMSGQSLRVASIFIQMEKKEKKTPGLRVLAGLFLISTVFLSHAELTICCDRSHIHVLKKSLLYS